MRRAAAAVKACAEPTGGRPGTAGRINIEVSGGLNLRQDDERAIASLIEGRPHVGIFVSRAWLSGFFADPPAGTRAALVLLREGTTLRGVAPIAIAESGAPVRVSLLGGGIGSDRVDLLAARGFEAACADAFVSWIDSSCGRRGYVLELRDVPAESPLWGAMHRTNVEGKRRLALQPREISTLPYLELATRQPIKSLDKHRRWLERRGRLRVETLHDHGEVMAAFESLSQFLHARWQGRQDGSALDDPRLRRFHRYVIPLLLRGGLLRMIRLSSDLRTVGVFYGLAVGKWWGYYLAGYDRQWAGRIHLGQLTLAAAIEAAAAEGATEFDFLKGVERVKYLWPVRERSAIDADAYSDNAASHFGRGAKAAREATAAFAKTARHLLAGVGHP